MILSSPLLGSLEALGKANFKITFYLKTFIFQKEQNTKRRCIGSFDILFLVKLNMILAFIYRNQFTVTFYIYILQFELRQPVSPANTKIAKLKNLMKIIPFLLVELFPMINCKISVWFLIFPSFPPPKVILFIFLPWPAKMNICQYAPLRLIIPEKSIYYDWSDIHGSCRLTG